MGIVENMVEGMQERAKSKLQDYEVLANLYAADREAFELERKRRIDDLIDTSSPWVSKTILRKAQVQWDAILPVDTAVSPS